MSSAVIAAAIKHLSETLKGMDKVAPGVHDVEGEVVVRVHGVVSKSEDVSYVPTTEIPLLSTLALVLEKSGFQRERSKALLIEAMQEALEAKVSADAAVKSRVRDIEEAMEHVRSVAASLPLKVRSGPTNISVAGEVLVTDASDLAVPA
jgi:hypothetical protein